MNKIEYLILSSSIDFSTDLICYELHKRNKRFLRLNRDYFRKYEILYSLQESTMFVKIDEMEYSISNDTIKGIYFRAPVFLRSHKKYNLNEQLYRSQWSSFIRNLISFDKAKWINHPVSTYQAENKMYQLKCAKEIGLNVPKTYIGNVLPQHISSCTNYIVKSLDTALFYSDSQELFTYSSIVNGEELLDANIKDAPIILQECLEDKQDLRVTVVGDKLFSISITNKGKNIYGDWRKISKNDLVYKEINLPKDIATKILKLMKQLGLVFGGVDLAVMDNKYYFIEVNPTGEWGWLSSGSDMPVDKAIVDELTNEV